MPHLKFFFNKYKNISKTIILILIFAIFIFFLFSYFKFKKTKEKLIPFELEGKTYLLKEAKNPKEWKRGLMLLKKPVNYDGMIFIFPNKEIRSFLNKNTFFDLDIYWLEDNKIIGKDFLPSITKSKNIITKTSPAPVNIVVEIIK
jgi:uncharacterized membrane protein (UPF0127 family)